MNLHTPERQSFETQAEYRDRRKQSQRAVKTMTKGPTQAPFIMIPGGPLPNWVHFWTGQHANEGKKPSRRDLHRLASKTFTHKAKPLKVRKHKPKAAIKPTWPGTPDQLRQQRPLIVVSPRKTAIQRLGIRRGIELFEAHSPGAKHHLDAVVLHFPG